MPALTSKHSKPHAALRWLICGTYVVTAMFVAIFLVMVLVALPVSLFFREITDVSNPPAYRITMLFIGLVLVLLYGLIIKRNYHNFPRNFWQVNADTVANFSIIFALLLATDWYHLLPPHLPKTIADYCGRNVYLISFAEADHGPGLSYRSALSYIAFFLFYKLIKAYLMQALDLSNPMPPHSSPPSAPDKRPDDPFVPFNPYELSRNPPYSPR